MNATPSVSTTDSPPATTTHITSPRLLTGIRVLWLAVAAICIAAYLLFMFTLYDETRRLPDAYMAELQQFGITPDGYFWVYFVLLTIVFGVFFAVGVLIYWRKYNERMVVLTSIFLLGFGTNNIIPTYLYILILNGSEDLRLRLIFAASALTSILGWGLLAPFFALFPDGRFVPLWSRYFVILGVMASILWVIFPKEFNFPQGIMAFFVPSLVLILFGVILYAQIYRYWRVSTPMQRQQTKWLVFGLGGTSFLVVTGNILSSVLVSSKTTLTFSVAYDFIALVVVLSFILIPLAIGASILRYRLWEIDVLINRSLVYAGVTALALAIFFAAMLVLQVIVGNTQPFIAIVIAIVITMVMFKSAQKRIQRFIDHRFYGLRFDLNEIAQAQKPPEVKNSGALTGRTLGGYRLLDVIGKGGMGEVYKGQGEGRTAALKILPEALAQEQGFLTRFEREAQTLTSLQHPHIVRMYSSGASDSTAYMAMEFVDGQELGDRLRQEGPISLDDVRDILRGLSSALDYAHERGFVHRDIKPSNIMLRRSEDGETWEAVLMDFGIAKIQDAQTAITGTGAIGTIDYMAPEQIVAAKEVDRRADIYALGVMPYEMLTGEKPFRGGPAQVMFAHIQQPAPDPRDLVPDLPREFAKAVLKALEKQPEDRFQTAGELAAALS